MAGWFRCVKEEYLGVALATGILPVVKLGFCQGSHVAEDVKAAFDAFNCALAECFNQVLVDVMDVHLVG